jgi:hypothetical protein
MTLGKELKIEDCWKLEVVHFSVEMAQFLSTSRVNEEEVFD